MPSSLENAVLHAISFLTSPLINKHDARTIDALHSALMHNLSVFYAPSWDESSPSTGSKQRVLSLSPSQLPPAPVWRSARTVGLLWTPWIAALGGFAFDLIVDPGCVAFRIGAWESVHIVWQEAPCAFTMKRKTLAQSIIDDEENAIFDMIEHEVSSSSSSASGSRSQQQHRHTSSSSSNSFGFGFNFGPSYSSSTLSSTSSTSSVTWMAPLLDQFPTVPAPAPAPSTHLRTGSNYAASISRSSSRASMISTSGFSFSSSSEASDSYTSLSSISSRSSLDLPSSETGKLQQQQQQNGTQARSRRSRPRIPNVFIDSNKKEVTNYDGGKTTVLTGGVMLGNPSGNNNSKTNKPRTGRW